jgi:hypothetical protein
MKNTRKSLATKCAGLRRDLALVSGSLAVAAGAISILRRNDPDARRELEEGLRVDDPRLESPRSPLSTSTESPVSEAIFMYCSSVWRNFSRLDGVPVPGVVRHGVEPRSRRPGAAADGLTVPSAAA